MSTDQDVTAGHQHAGQRPDQQEPMTPPPGGEKGEAYWDERYSAAEHHHLWSGRPNSQLVELLADVTPGVALDVGCGEGADAVWLAQRGWQVVGADISGVAIARAREHARQAGPVVNDRTTFVRADLTAGEVPPSDPSSAEPDGDDSTYDLVTSSFIHVGPGLRDTLHQILAGAVRPGGLLLVCAHHPSDLELGVRRPSSPEYLFTPEEVVAVLDPQQWQVLVAEARPRRARGHEGEDDLTVHDTVVLARREERAED